MKFEIPSFYRKSSDGVYVMDAPNGCEYPLRYSDFPHDVGARGYSTLAPSGRKKK